MADQREEAIQAILDLLDRRDTLRSVGRPYEEYRQECEKAAGKVFDTFRTAPTEGGTNG